VAGTRDLATNICPVTFGADAFRVQARDIAEGEDLRALRQAHAPKWSVQWEQGQVFFLPLAGGLRAPEGTVPVELEVAGNLRLLARLTTEALVRSFPDYEPLRRRPFVFLGRRQELMRDAARVLNIDHALLGDFRIWPKYSLDARVLEVRDGSPFVGITVDLATRWEITSGLEELQDAGVDLASLFVVRRDPDPGQRRLVGRIAAVRAGRVELSESTDNTATADVKSVMLEGRREAFALPAAPARPGLSALRAVPGQAAGCPAGRPGAAGRGGPGRAGPAEEPAGTGQRPDVLGGAPRGCRELT
jgi:hypothetical protein